VRQRQIAFNQVFCGYLARKRLINTIIVFTNTKGVSDDYDWLDENRVFNDNYEERLGGIFKFQEMHPHSQLLLVFDDVLGAVKLDSKNMTTLVTQFRHFRISWILSTQYLYKIPPVIRENVFHAALFACTTKRQLEAAYESYGASHFDTIKEWRAFMESCTGDYKFLFISNKEGNAQLRYRCMRAPAKLDFVRINQ
jgi:hypothetical protein